MNGQSEADKQKQALILEIRQLDIGQAHVRSQLHQFADSLRRLGHASHFSTVHQILQDSSLLSRFDEVFPQARMPKIAELESVAQESSNEPVMFLLRKIRDARRDIVGKIVTTLRKELKDPVGGDDRYLSKLQEMGLSDDEARGVLAEAKGVDTRLAEVVTAIEELRKNR